MSKLAVCLLALAVVAAVQAAVIPVYQTELEKAVNAGDWEKAHELIAYKFRFNPYGDLTADAAVAVSGLLPIDSIFFTSVRDLKPPGRTGKVYGTAQSSFRSSTNDNGDVRESSGGYKVINDNGHVTEYSFTPQ